MNTPPSNLVLKADPKVLAKDIRLRFILIFILLALTAGAISALISLNTQSNFISIGAAILFLFGAYICAMGLPKTMRDKRQLPEIYTLSYKGIHTHKNGMDFVWSDFDPFYFSKDSSRLFMPFSDKRTKALTIDTSKISEHSYNAILAYLKSHAPKALTLKIR